MRTTSNGQRWIDPKNVDFKECIINSETFEVIVHRGFLLLRLLKIAGGMFAGAESIGVCNAAEEFVDKVGSCGPVSETAAAAEMAAVSAADDGFSDNDCAEE